jgi:hypothetical protein
MEALMIRSTTISTLRWLTLVGITVGTALWLASCSSDATGPQAQGSSNVLTFHANHGLTASKFNFKIDTATIASLNYGEWAQTLVANGSSTVKVFTTSGTETASSSVSLDSTHSSIVLFCGDDATREAFKVTSPLIAPSGGNCAIRVVHASNNAGDVVVKINSVNGLSFTSSNLSYKNGTDFVELPVASTDSLLVLKPGTTDVILSVQTKALLSALKNYTIVLYGSTSQNADPSVKFTSKMIQEN